MGVVVNSPQQLHANRKVSTTSGANSSADLPLRTRPELHFGAVVDLGLGHQRRTKAQATFFTSNRSLGYSHTA